MIEHGRFLINKSIEIIKRYSLLYPQLIALNLTDDKIAYYRIIVIHFMLDDINNYISIHFNEERFYKQLHIWKNNTITCKATDFLLSDVYDQIKDVLLTQNIREIHIVGKEGVSVKINYLDNH